jgi:hypothetical protein
LYLSSKLLCHQEEGGVEMKIDYHVHLEEGPYSANWIGRTANALEFFMEEKSYSHRWMQSLLAELNNRVKEGDYSEYWLDLYLERAKAAWHKASWYLGPPLSIS